MVASHLTGWASNPPLQFATNGKSPCAGQLRRIPSPAEGPGSETTFNSQVGAPAVVEIIKMCPHCRGMGHLVLIVDCCLQPAFVFPLTFEDGGTLFIYMGDRWNYYGPGCVSLHPAYHQLTFLYLLIICGEGKAIQSCACGLRLMWAYRLELRAMCGCRCCPEGPKRTDMSSCTSRAGAPERCAACRRGALSPRGHSRE